MFPSLYATQQYATQTFVLGPRPWPRGLFTLSARLVDGGSRVRNPRRPSSRGSRIRPQLNPCPLRHPLGLDRHARLPPSRTCDRVLRFAPEPVYTGVTGCYASRSTTFSSDRPATGRVVFLVCGVWGCRVYAFCVSAAAGGPSNVAVFARCRPAGTDDWTAAAPRPCCPGPAGRPRRTGRWPAR